MILKVNKMIHVTDLLHFERCPYFIKNQREKQEEFQAYYHMLEPFSKTWMCYFHLEDAPCGHTGDSNNTSLELLHKNGILVQGRFSYKNCRTRIPILKQIADGYEAIYPYLSAFPKEKEARMMKVNKEILAHLGISITKHKILYLNKDYVRQDDLDLNQLFLVSDCLFNRRNNLHLSIDACMEKETFDLDSWIEQTEALLQNLPNHKPERNKRCTQGRRCPFYESCFDDSTLPDDSIAFLTTSSKKLQALESGIEHVSQLDPKLLEGFRLQYAQYMASKNGLFIDHVAIKTWLEKLQEPISYLDFEWDTFAIPPYKNMKPFDVLCFQYSLHVEDEDQNLTHLDFFNYGDCREAFIQSLIASVPKTGSILVYNMEGAEKLRLIQLGEQFPQYADDLAQIYDRMIDLSKPFECGLYYDNRMHGHYSLKNILPIFTDSVSYNQLSIKDGLNAVYAYRNFEKADEQKRSIIRQNIRTYCQMDTYAEYVVYHGLLKAVKEG